MHAPTRAEAIVRMRIALESFAIEGVHTTIPFLHNLLDDPDVVAGRMDTKLVERRMAASNEKKPA